MDGLGWFHPVDVWVRHKEVSTALARQDILDDSCWPIIHSLDLPMANPAICRAVGYLAVCADLLIGGASRAIGDRAHSQTLRGRTWIGKRRAMRKIDRELPATLCIR